jgi:hypothetical protein
MTEIGRRGVIVPETESVNGSKETIIEKKGKGNENQDGFRRRDEKKMI